jgi:serine/threonine protein kinase
MSLRWRQIAPSEFPWEREALAFVREGLPDQEPYRAWANLEFIAEDGIHEVDLLVLAPKGFFLVEIKSWPGTLEGDATTWVLRRDGKVQTFDSPLLLANRKARKLASLLKHQKAVRGVRLPLVEPLVFLSHPGLSCKLTGTARQGVYLRDHKADASTPGRPGILAALAHLDPTEPFQPGKIRIYRPVALAVEKAIEEAGIRPSQRARRVGDFLLEELLYTGPNYQDWQARHATAEKIRRRVRIYSLAAAGAEAREQLERAARREMEVLEPLQHPAILKPLQLTRHELGPALVFEHDPKSVRLDHFLVQAGSRVGFADRLALVRQIAETLQYVHDKRVFHRALSPQSILVKDPEAATPELRILNWQTAAQEILTTRATETGLTGTSHLDQLVEDAALVYLAPESLTVPDALPETLDVFSLGALAYLLFSGQPPAASVLDLHDLLRAGKGLQLSAALDGAPPGLVELIELATHPVVTERIPSVADFLGYLEIVEKERPRADGEPVADPLSARAGDLLPDGFRVLRRLGRGSTSVVYLVSRDGTEQVLKLAIDSNADERLRAEAGILAKLSHPRLVQFQGTTPVGDRFGLLLARAGDETLAHRIRQEGRLQLELLERWGEDLLQAVDYLERVGVPHRDLKPDNLGVAKAGRNDELHLVLFDFSLSATPAENLFAGTKPYLDPFLIDRRPRRWDLQAERFAAAVTLYEMATGTLPRWGDGQSNPAMVKEEARIDSELLDADVRAALTSFFRQALARSPKKRFDNAEEMLGRWRCAFEVADRPATTTTATGEQPDLLALACQQAEPETPVSLLHLSTRAVNALERAQVVTVRDLLRLLPSRISHMRGVGSKTRKELLEAIRLLVDRFGRVTDESPAPLAPGEAELTLSSLDRLVRLILPARTNATGERRILETLFGLAEDVSPLASPWPSQTDAAEALGLTRARVSQVLVKARQRWLRNPAITALRDEIARLLDGQAGVMTLRELCSALLATRGSAQEEPLRSRYAAAALRAATETEESRGEPRWTFRRTPDRVVFALTGTEGEEEALLDYVEALGRRADLLARQDPLASPQRAVEDLQAVPRGIISQGQAQLTPERLLRLATAASRAAALSSRLEIYPRDLPPDRALRLASGALLGGRDLTVQEIRERVRSRYPEAPELPNRPQLDQLIREVGLGLEWDSATRNGHGSYTFPLTFETTLSSSSLPSRQSTTLAPQPTAAELAPHLVDARMFEDRLQRADREGAFLALLVNPKHLVEAEAEISRRFGLEARSLEALWIDAMKRLAAENQIDWSLVLRSDAQGAGDPDARSFSNFVTQALARVEADLASSPRTVLLTRPGLLARYDHISFLTRLRERVTSRPAPGQTGLHGLWLLVPSDGSTDGPRIDGEVVPTITPSQWGRVPEAWIHNHHRSGHHDTASTDSLRETA